MKFYKGNSVSVRCHAFERLAGLIALFTGVSVK